MRMPAHRPTPYLFALLLAIVPHGRAQVFVVGEKTATSEIKTDFVPTDLPLPDGKLGERGKRELIRLLEAEQGFAHRSLPIGPGVQLQANGPLTPGPDRYRQMLYQKGESVAPGDRVVITAMQIKPDRIVLDLNGGPYAKHRFLSHVQFNNSNVVAADPERPNGSRITLLFERQIPDVSAPEVKALLAPLIDFGAKTSEQAYAETLPPLLKEAIAEHTVLVGMDHRMVLAALGAPDNKVREHAGESGEGPHYEEWIYGHVPQTVQFIRFRGDRVSTVKTAALGKPIEVRDKDELQGYVTPPPTRQIAYGDAQPSGKEAEGTGTGPTPTLKQPGEDLPGTIADSPNRVQLPPSKPATVPKVSPDASDH